TRQKSDAISVRHRVNHEIQADANGVAGILFGIAVEIHILPRVTEVGVVGNGDHQSPRLIGYSINSRLSVVALFPGSSATAALSGVRRLDDPVDVKKSVEDWMGERNWLNWILGENLSQFGFKIFFLE